MSFRIKISLWPVYLLLSHRRGIIPVCSSWSGEQRLLSVVFCWCGGRLKEVLPNSGVARWSEWLLVLVFHALTWLAGVMVSWLAPPPE